MVTSENNWMGFLACEFLLHPLGISHNVILVQNAFTVEPIAKLLMISHIIPMSQKEIAYPPIVLTAPPTVV